MTILNVAPPKLVQSALAQFWRLIMGTLVAKGSSIDAVGAIWNPVAIVNWSLPFTPAFGSWLQMLNWQELGEPELAEIAKRWFYASLGMLLFYAVFGGMLASSDVGLSVLRVLPILYLVVWYYGSARPHLNHVKERFGNDYNRRPWKKPLLAAAALAATYIGLQLLASAYLAGGRAT